MIMKKVVEKCISKKKPLVYNKNHDLQYSTRSILDIFNKMSDKKKILVDELGFAAMRHILSLNVMHKLLKKLANSLDLYNSSLDTQYEKIKITHDKIRNALGLA
ncbi:hypothetical protein AHAS_Ahas17G0162000 [Arachis hypogaea]